ncbi:hypothetical protein, partial [Endozoicomonas sp. ALB122]|uniref:hypothetical protein n=1 Tax=Endozoicomonas sp. ALB122 TaxID=3403075 RepID=UPI003BB4FAEE
IASYLTNKSGFSDQFAAAAVGQSILGQPPRLSPPSAAHVPGLAIHPGKKMFFSTLMAVWSILP